MSLLALYRTETIKNFFPELMERNDSGESMEKKQFIALCLLHAKERDDVPLYAIIDEQENRDKLISIAKIIDDIIKGFDYSKSKMFIESTLEKGSAYRNKLAEISLKPQRYREIMNYLYNAIRSIETSDELLQFMPIGSEQTLIELRQKLNSL